MNNQQGSITIDFLFAIIMSIGLVMASFQICYGLVAVEVNQYIAFSVARAAMAAEEKSPMAGGGTFAQDKFADITKNPIFKSFMKGNWFKLIGDPAYNDFTSEYHAGQDVPAAGVRMKMSVSVFNVNVPFLSKSDGQPFTFNITGFLTPEPSQSECQNAFIDRPNAIFQLDSRFSSSDARNVPNPDQLAPSEDNGC